mgnify:CR=1 FL=1
MAAAAGQNREIEQLKTLLFQPEATRLSSLEADLDSLQRYVGNSDRLETATAGILVEALERAEVNRPRELASAIDNPVVVGDRVESNGNFHGAPVAYVLDFLAIVAADVASMAERRTDRMLDKSRSHGLPPFLADDPGVDSGFMIAQYTQAGLVSEMKRLAMPASVDSIPSSAMQEDHVSMGWSAARKLRKAVDGLQRVLAVEILTAARAIDMREGTPAKGTGAVIEKLRETVEGPGVDRYLSPEIEETVRLVKEGALIDAVEDVATYVQLGKKELSASQLAERLGFSAKRQRTPVGDLSGGERRRDHRLVPGPGHRAAGRAALAAGGPLVHGLVARHLWFCRAGAGRSDRLDRL